MYVKTPKFQIKTPQNKKSLKTCKFLKFNYFYNILKSKQYFKPTNQNDIPKNQ